ncbi:MAG: ABC transporter permease [Frankiaceae bacterium]|nr:ABC transporter permease [Frankiaceae bacterium]MBV9870921.1 ABC transporter permease [Frankiaceae bacterium]
MITATTSAPARRRLLRNPWRRPVFLEGFTWLYIAWSLLPIGLAVLFSFNNGRSQSVWQGFSMRWYTGDPLQSVLHDPTLHAAIAQTLKLALFTTVIAVPLGVAFAIGVDRWRSRPAEAANFVMVFSFVIPELIFGVALFFVFNTMFTSVHLGTLAETIGLVTWNLSWPAIIVRARLVSIGRQYEEAAADLGATRLQAIRRVLLPMLAPAIFASAVLVFSGVIDDFVLVNLLSSTSKTEPMSVLIYSNTHGGNGGPALNALATLMLLFSFVVAIIGFVGYRLMTRGERTSTDESLATFAGM